MLKLLTLATKHMFSCNLIHIPQDSSTGFQESLTFFHKKDKY